MIPSWNWARETYKATWFEGRLQTSNAWVCHRVELNATIALELVVYIEAALERHRQGCALTLFIQPTVKAQSQFVVEDLVRADIEAIINLPDIAADIVPDLQPLKGVGFAAVNKRLEKRPLLSWRDATRRTVHAELSKQRTTLQQSIQEANAEAINNCQTNGVNERLSGESQKPGAKKGRLFRQFLVVVWQGEALATQEPALVLMALVIL